jgi:hypothetical protein|tara:strand:- start:28333 stop:28527 length:195 start_codon:yes stop_codon:yes gene_type:complete
MKINILPLLLISGLLQAGNGEFDTKYGVFVWVALIVLCGIFIYLTRLEIKVGKLERKIKENDEA